MPIEGAEKVGLLSFIAINAILILRRLRASGKPRALPSERFPWGELRKAYVAAFICLMLITRQGNSAADLVFYAIFIFGGGTFVMAAFWLWDRHTLRRHRG